MLNRLAHYPTEQVPRPVPPEIVRASREAARDARAAHEAAEADEREILAPLRPLLPDAVLLGLSLMPETIARRAMVRAERLRTHAPEVRATDVLVAGERGTWYLEDRAAVRRRIAQRRAGGAA